jgi:hypothetical protein
VMYADQTLNEDDVSSWISIRIFLGLD